MLSATWRASARALWLAVCCAGALGCSESRPEASVGGDTHWLEACTEDADCERGSCLCGVCTESCTRDAQCAGAVEGRCIETESQEIVAACGPGAEPPLERTGICLARCTEADGDTDRCTEGLECSSGVCVPASVPELDASEPPAVVSARPSTRASEFADLQSSATLSFEDEVVPVPAPERVFRDPAEALLGTWRQPDCDPADSETQYFSGGCVTLVFERSGPAGEIRGRLDSYTEVDTAAWEVPKQTFAPAGDPDIGYPVEVGPEDYFDLSLNPRMGPYTLLDPRFDGELLQFWVSSLELWEGWCALQTSYRVPGGMPAYQCVPDGAAYGDPAVDRGKLVLCTSEWSSGVCDPSYCGLSAAEPCPPESHVGCGCMGASGYDMERPECSIAYCRCDADGCAPNWYERRRDFQLIVDGDRMVGREGLRRSIANMGVLEREVAP